MTLNPTPRTVVSGGREHLAIAEALEFQAASMERRLVSLPSEEIHDDERADLGNDAGYLRALASTFRRELGQAGN